MYGLLTSHIATTLSRNREQLKRGGKGKMGGKEGRGGEGRGREGR